MAVVPYQVTQAGPTSISSPSPLVTIAGDNPTPFYLHFPSLPPPFDWVFPYTYGFVFPVGGRTPSINVFSQDTPPGFPIAPTSTAVATVSAYDYLLDYQAGVRLAQGSGWTFAGSKTLAAGADSITSLVVPPTTKALMIVVRAGGGPTGTDLRGVTTNTNYWTPVGTVRGATMIPVNGQEDTQYTANFAAGAGATVALYATDFLVDSISQGTQSTTRSVPVTLASDQLSVTPWLSAESWARVTQVGAGNSVLIAGVAGQIVYMFGGVVEVSTGAGSAVVRLNDSTGTTVVEWSAVNAITYTFELNGAAIGAAGVGAQIQVFGGAATASITLAYSQG